MELGPLQMLLQTVVAIHKQIQKLGEVVGLCLIPSRKGMEVLLVLQSLMGWDQRGRIQMQNQERPKRIRLQEEEVRLIFILFPSFRMKIFS